MRKALTGRAPPSMITEMGGPASMRDEPGGPRLAAIARALGLVLAAGCGPPLSLDASGTTGSSATGSTGASTHGSADTAAEDDAPPPDVPTMDVPEPRLPPGECPAGCAVELRLAWAWDEERRPPGDPPVPPVPGAEERLSAMIRALDGSFVVATQRDGGPWLTRVDRDGGLVWSVPLPLEFGSEIVDLALHPSGKLAVLAEGIINAYQLLVLARVDPSTPSIETQGVSIINGTENRPARAGSVMPLNEEQGETAVLVVESGVTIDGAEQDAIRILYYYGSRIVAYRTIDTQLASAPPRRPKGALLTTGEIMITIPGTAGAGTDEYVVWLDPVSLYPLESEPLPGPADAVAVGPDGALVVAGHTARSPAQGVLQAMGLPRKQPPAWLYSADVPTTTPSSPVVAVDARGHAYVALRTTAGTPDAPGEAAVALMRLAADGTPLWSTTLPLASDPSAKPITLSLADDDVGLVLAAIVDGHLHLERREQGCRCD